MASVKGGNTAGPSDVAVDTVASEDVQRVKLVFGDATTATRVSSSDPLPVALDAASLSALETIELGATSLAALESITASGPLTDAQLRAAAVPVSAASLPLPTGAATLAEQQTQSASLSVVDDWDESDRAKVNPIVGQAGIAAGAGAVGVTVPRVTLASDDPAVALLTTIDADTSAIAAGFATETTLATVAAAVRQNDAAWGATHYGVAAYGVRDDALTTLGVVDGDYTPARIDANGALWVQLAGALSSSVDSIAAVGTIAHDSPSTANPLMAGGYASAAAPTSVSGDGDAVRAWYLRNGAAATVLTAAGALVGGDASNGLDVDVTRLPALVAGTANIGDVDVLTVPAPLSTTGTGTEATALRVTLATDSTGLVSVDDNGASITVDAPVGTPAFVRLSDGSAAITTLPVSLASVPSHAVTNAGTFAVQVAAATTGGATPSKLIDIDESEDEVKATAGTVLGWVLTNLASGTRYVKFYNATAANVTVGTTTPTITIAIPAGAGVVMPVGGPGIAFGTAICVAATTGVADADTGAPGANEIVGTVFYA